MTINTLKTKKHYDIIIVGAGAAGLMCAISAGKNGHAVLILEKSNKVGNKILISGGGRCNFTNLNIVSEAYLSPNPHFCKSALSRYTQWHFIELLQKHGLTYQEKTLGQLFCEQKSKAIIEMLLDEIREYDISVAYEQDIQSINCQQNNDKNQYTVATQNKSYTTPNLVIACGGPSFPKLGASHFALQVAKQFGIKNTPFSPALVPLTLPELLLKKCRPLAGVSQFVSITCQQQSFQENLLFTHRGISGPAVLQISSYWKKGDSIGIDFAPDKSLETELKRQKKQHPQQKLSRYLATLFPNKLAETLVTWFFTDQPLQQFSDNELVNIAKQLHHWEIQPSGSEGMRKAEVSLGGIHPDALSGKTFECQQQKGLYFIGEAVDVTGWLGGYNFQWAWSSGWCCGEAIGN